MDFHDQQDLARYRRRKRKQRDYQQGYRERLKEARTPERDDIAAVLMRVFINAMVVDHRQVVNLMRPLFSELATAGYDREASIKKVQGMALRAQARLARERARD